MLDITDVAQLLETNITITIYPEQRNEDGKCRCVAKLESIDTQNHKNEGVLRREHGDGFTIQEAIDDYVSKIRGKNLVKHAFANDRKEWECPAHVSSITL